MYDLSCLQRQDFLLLCAHVHACVHGHACALVSCASSCVYKCMIQNTHAIHARTRGMTPLEHTLSTHCKHTLTHSLHAWRMLCTPLHCTGAGLGFLAALTGVSCVRTDLCFCQCVYVSVCICVCVYMCICVCVYVWICTRTLVYVNNTLYACTQV